MTVAHVYGITFKVKQRNCTLTIKQHKITHNEKGHEDRSQTNMEYGRGLGLACFVLGLGLVVLVLVWSE